MVTAMFNMKIPNMQIDPDTDISNMQKDFYAKRGVQLKMTVAYTPQQNGVAEIFNQTVIHA